jgi:hypothetical protein
MINKNLFLTIKGDYMHMKSNFFISMNSIGDKI